MITKEKIIEAIKSMNLYDDYILDYVDSVGFNLTEDTILKYVSHGVLYHAGQRAHLKQMGASTEELDKLIPVSLSNCKNK